MKRRNKKLAQRRQHNADQKAKRARGEKVGSPRLAQTATKGKMKFINDDGGRAEAGYKGDAGRLCDPRHRHRHRDPLQGRVRRSQRACRRERPRAGRRRSSARNGVFRQTYHRYMLDMDWVWIPTMQIGSGCQVHLRKKELPKGNLVVRLSKHVTAVIDGKIHDTHDPPVTVAGVFTDTTMGLRDVVAKRKAERQQTLLSEQPKTLAELRARKQARAEAEVPGRATREQAVKQSQGTASEVAGGTARSEGKEQQA